MIKAIRSSIEGAIDPNLVEALRKKHNGKVAAFTSRIGDGFPTLYVSVIHDGQDENLTTSLIPRMSHLNKAGIDPQPFLACGLNRIY